MISESSSNAAPVIEGFVARGPCLKRIRCQVLLQKRLLFSDHLPRCPNPCRSQTRLACEPGSELVNDTIWHSHLSTCLSTYQHCDRRLFTPGLFSKSRLTRHYVPSDD
ncbi:hypothetical protein J1614_006812 [Plenodomus biglobosus]|nr:hypothetical protein J1614_006812 [Plenodomus biglobosus]